MKNLLNKIDKIEEQIEKYGELKKNKVYINEMKKIGVEKLPYSFNALKQFIDPETMSVHYNGHYKTYVEKLNLALDKKKYGDLDLEQIVKTISRFNKTIRNNAGGAYNHALFWKMLTPKTQKPQGLILKKIEHDFDTIANFKKKFEEVAKERFGSGWVWLVVTKNNTLKIMSTPNQDNPLMNDVENGGFPILGLDLWEHAYYLKYKNKRDEYIKNFWKVVNWEFVEKLLKMKIQTRVDEEIVISQLMNKSNLLTEDEIKNVTTTNKEEILFKKLLFPNSDGLKKKRINFKQEYLKGWLEILSKAYPNHWKNKNELFVGHQPGLYNKEKDRLLLMNLTSSYSSFCLITKLINLYLLKNNLSPIEFGDDEKHNHTELLRFFSIIDSLRHYIFLPQETSPILIKITTKLFAGHCLGNRNKNIVEKILNTTYGDETCKLINNVGITKDTNNSVDAIIQLNDKTYTSQIKPYKSIIQKDNVFIVTGSSALKVYHNLNLYIFVNSKSKTLWLFKTQNSRIFNGSYIIPIENEFLKIVGDRNLELIDCYKYLS